MPRDHNSMAAPVVTPPTAGGGPAGVRGAVRVAASNSSAVGLALSCAGGCLFLLAACDGPQSALDPAGSGAERIAALYWWMTGGAVTVWLIVAGMAAYALARPGSHSRRKTGFYVIGGGVVFPVVVLSVLLTYGLQSLPDLLEPAPEGSLTIEVRGEQWWWHVHYPSADGGAVLANEIRLPVDEPVQFVLEAGDVIHSFWIPNLGGKMDMIPGRQTRLTLEPKRTGVYRGACAELCGESHAVMAFDVIVMEKDAFARWLDHQAQPAREPGEGLPARGRDVFLAAGCGACHTVRGTSADGVLAPDLTHIGSRISLGGGEIEPDLDGFQRWIARPASIKPGVHMPAFEMLPPDDLGAIAAYLDALE